MFLNKKLFLPFFLLTLLFPIGAVHAIGTPAPTPVEKNVLCWQKADCDKARKDFGAPADVNGWLEKEGECDKVGWGKCLPAGQSDLTISFGGIKQFKNVGEYIKTVYNYLLTVGSILAVIMIILAGVQWVTSGGSSEAITAAKKRIVGAVIGLVIAYLSFVILNTINPTLTNLRLPQIYLVRPILAPMEFCREIPLATTTPIFAYVAGLDTQTTDLKDKYAASTPQSYSMTYPANREDVSGDKRTFWCGQRFFAKDSLQPCFGDRCDPGQMCVNYKPTEPNAQWDPKNPYRCKKGTIAGTIAVGNSFRVDPGCLSLWDGWEFPNFTDEGEQELHILCKDGRHAEIDSSAYTYTGSKNQNYFIDANYDDLNKKINNCGGDTQVKGFYMKFEMDEACDPKDENHWIGIENGKGKDLGDDEFFLDNIKNINSKYLIPLANIRASDLSSFDIMEVVDIDDDIGSDSERDIYKPLLTR